MSTEISADSKGELRGFTNQLQSDQIQPQQFNPSLIPKVFGEYPQTPQPDPIIGLLTEFLNDTHPDKLNAAIGYLVDEQGRIFLPDAVQVGFDRLVARGDLLRRDGYVSPELPLGWSGNKALISETARMIYGEKADSLLDNNLIAATTTIGGTHGVALVAKVVAETRLGQGKKPVILIGDPPYPNHPPIFKANGLQVKTYDHTYKDGEHAGEFNLGATLQAIRKAGPNTLVVLQGAQHNPTGVNAKTAEQWKEIAQAAKDSGVTVFFDMPYPGTGDRAMGDDFEPVRIFMDAKVPTIVTTSFSKIGGLYEWRVGGVYIACPDAKYALDTTSKLNELVRQMNSSPAGPGQRIMGEVLSDEELLADWQARNIPEIAAALQVRRSILAHKLPEQLGELVRNGEGLFTVLPITAEGAEYLKEVEHVYVVKGKNNMSIRVNIGGLTSAEMYRAAKAIKRALDRFHA